MGRLHGLGAVCASNEPMVGKADPLVCPTAFIEKHPGDKLVRADRQVCSANRSFT